MKFLLNLGMKCWNSGLSAGGFRTAVIGWRQVNQGKRKASWNSDLTKFGAVFSLHIYLWRKNQDASDCVVGVFGKLSMRRGAWAWFHVWTCGAKVLEYWMIFYLKIELNCSFNFWRNWNVPFLLLERSWWAGFNGIYLVRFGFRMWYILILKWFLPLKIQINSKNPGFERKNQLRTW